MQYEVQIIRSTTGEVVEILKCSSRSKADKVDDGVNINLNHEEYHTVIKEK